jgi:hypothetical protein
MAIKHWLTIFIFTILLSGCAKSPESTVESFYRAVGKGEITEAQSYLSSQIIGMIGKDKMAAALAKQSEQVSECGGIDSVEVELTGEGEIRSGNATVTFKGNCQPKKESVKLIKEDGKWKITANK